jgi:hypothetical protein
MRIDEAKLRERAYLLWEQEGRPEGATQSHWKQAAVELQAEAQAEADRDQDTSNLSAGSEGSGKSTAQPVQKHH